ncbi:MFS transporter, partial [Streptomyces lavendulocolor]
EAPAHGAGGAAAIGETSYQLGAGMGIALLGSVMNAAYAPGLAGVPGVPAPAGAAAANSLGEAYQVAERLGGPAGEALRTAARHSFVHGLHVTLAVSAGLLLLGALMALRLPRVMDCRPDADARLGGADGAWPEQEGAARPGAAPVPQVPARREPAEPAGSGRTAGRRA